MTMGQDILKAESPANLQSFGVMLHTTQILV